MTSSYVLPVVALIETLRGMSTLITLRAQLPKRFQGLNETCFAEIVIEAGKLRSCDIQTTNGRALVFSPGDAFALLQELGPLKWELIASSRRGVPVLVQGGPPAEQASATRNIPRKIVTTVSPAQFRRLSQRHKQIFLLIDGRKDSMEIAWLLSIPQSSVESILADLHQWQLISF